MSTGPTSRNGHCYDPLRIPSSLPLVQPVNEDQIYFLFLALARCPGYFETTRPQIELENFDGVCESHWQLFWYTLCRCYDAHGAVPGYATVYQTVRDEYNAKLAFQLTEEQWVDLMREDGQGILRSIYDVAPADLTADAAAHADAIFRQFIRERTLVRPLLMKTSSGSSDVPS